MKITSIGGGPAGLYFGILMKKAFPQTEITILERNRADDTFGWGVVFSDETLGNFETADPESYQEIRKQFAYWGDIDTYYQNKKIRSTGHGFCGLSRKKLLQIFHRRCEELGVKLEFQKEVADPSQLKDPDLILAADGANSFVRQKYAEHFKPTISMGKCKFCWLGTDKPLEAFTFIFRENEHGLFQIHAYPFEKNLSTFIVECREETWKKAGLDKASEAETVAYCEKLFADDLKGHKLLTNRSIWRSFPTISNEKWHHENIVLLGDSAHTAHFSIGSGTKLAMEDAISLVAAFQKHGTKDIPKVLEAYEQERRPECSRIQRAAQTSREWFENSSRYLGQKPFQFVFNLMTRSKRITYDNLQQRDPKLIQDVTEEFWKETKTQKPATVPPMFAPFSFRDLKVSNRVVVSPMCQYSANDGTVNDWHLVHLGSRAIGGAGLVISEMTDVSPEGRISPGCAGMYKEEHVLAWKKIVDFVHANSAARMGIQLAHAGRKASCSRPWEGDSPLKGPEAWQTFGPSAIPFYPGAPAPKEMSREDMKKTLNDFIRATEMSDRAGFELIELHMAHGYLLSSFLSPKSNLRKDDYGGSLENRARFPLEVFSAVRAKWPKQKPLIVRISATDWLDDRGGQTVEESVQVARWLKELGCDAIDVSSAGNTPESKPVYGRMYQVPFAEQIRHEAGIPVISVGGIMNADHVNTVVAAGRADLCALARPHLSSPYLTLDAAIRYQYGEQEWPKQYLAVKPRPTKT